MYPRAAWRSAVVSVTALLLLTFFLYQQAIIYLIGKWNELESGEYGHGYLVILICGYLIYYNRQRLATLTPCPEYRAIVAVLAAGMLWLVSALVDIEMLQAVGLLLLVLAILWVVLGTRIMRVLAFPVLYVGFAIPVWFPLSPILQELTADVVFWLIRVLEIPALRIENMIVLPAGRMSIEEACSGLRYFVAALTLGTLFAYLNYTALRDRFIVVLISAGAGVLANILRVFIVVYLGYTTEMQHSLVRDHLMFGWYLFGGIVVVLLVIDAVLHRVQSAVSNDAVNTASDEVVSSGQLPGDQVLGNQNPGSQATCNKTKLQYMAVVLSAGLLVSAGPTMVYWVNNQPQSMSSPTQANLFVDTDGEWSAMDDSDDDWVPLYKGAIDHKIIFRDKDNHEIHLYLGMYLKQVQGEELINDLNKISDDKIWHSSYQRAKSREVNGQRVLEQLLQKNNGTRRLVWYWYCVAGRNTVNKYQAKLLQVMGLLKGIEQASIIAIAIDLEGESEYKREILTRFIEKMGPLLIREIEDKR